jgi:LytS/YehU family sensor histidine kinase
VLTEFEVTVEEILDKLSPFNRAGVTSDKANELITLCQEMYPGNYTIEEYYNSDEMRFKHRLKFDTESDELWFKLKYQ